MGLICRNSDKSFASGIYLCNSLKRGIYTNKFLIQNQIQFISAALPCYIIKPSPDFQLVNIQQGCKLNKGCWITMNWFIVCILTSSVIYYWTETRQLGIYLLNRSWNGKRQWDKKLRQQSLTIELQSCRQSVEKWLTTGLFDACLQHFTLFVF